MTTLAHELTSWEVVEAKLRRMVSCHRGNSLTERDNRTYATALALFGCLLSDLRNRHGQIGPDREIIAFLYNLKKLDVSLVGSFLSDAIVVLRNVSEPTTISWFKRQLSEYPVGSLVAPYRSLLKIYLEHPSPEGFLPLNQILSFLTRLSLQDLHLDLESEYCDLEERLKSQHIPGYLLDKLHEIIVEWLEGFEVSSDSFRPSHGPGATAELPRVATLEMKYDQLSTDQLLSYVLRRIGVGLEIYPYPPKPLMRTSKVVFVPKSMKTRRVISKEPAGLMYIQQAVLQQLARFISRHAFLQQHLTLEDQSFNGQLALVGSASQSFSTIDLSAASDSVTLPMVKALFRGTRLYPFLIATRSRRSVLPSGKIVDLEKFAPMGSALCFPIESLIFSAAVEYAVRRARTGLGNYPIWRVYGDDIVVATPLYEDVVMVLEALGFTVNSSKSYTSPSRFRESCGIEAYDGTDVSPLRISRRFYSVEKGKFRGHAALYVALLKFANEAFFRGFTTLRSYLHRIIFDEGRIVPLFSADNPGALYSAFSDNYRALSRFNHHYQRLEYRVDVVGSEPCKDPRPDLDDRGRYVETLRLIVNRSGDMFSPDSRVIVPRCTETPVMRRTWVGNA